MKRQGLKKIISVLMIIIMLINVIPNFGLLKSVTYAAEPSKGIVLKPGLSSFETMTDGSKRFVLNIYMKDISSAIGVVDFTYNSDKLIPAKYTETDLTSMGMGVIKQLTDSTNFTDAAQYSNVIDNSYDGNSYIDASNSEIYATFIEKDSNPVEAVGEIIICSINFKVVDDSLNFSDITAEDFGINAEYSFVNIDGVDEQEGFFHVEGFSNTTTPVVTSISITTDPKKEYIVGESLDLSSMVVTATYDNDPTNTKVLTDSEYTTNASELDLTTAGTPTLKVTYKGTDIAEGASAPTADVNLTVREEKITKIEFQGFDTSYKQGDTIDLSKISVIATYEKSGDKVLTSDKYTLTATGNSIVGNGITLTNSGDTIITATLKEDTSKTATKTITIAEKQLIGIEVTAPTKDVYKVGDTLDLAGLTVNAKYSNNGTETTEQVTTGYTTSITNGDKLNNAGVQTITVNYKGQTATFDIVVFPTKLVGTEEDSLSTVEVTEGFEWDNGSNTLSVGENTYLLKYTNTDPAKVKTNSVEVLGIPSNLTATYGETLADVKYNNGTLPNGFSWADATTSVGNAGEQTHSISYTGYTNLNAKVTVAKKTLTKVDLTYTMLSGKTYNGQPINDINVTVPTGAGTVTVKYYKDGETTGTTTAPTNVGTYTVKVSVLDGTNYTALAETELDGSFAITKATLVENNFALLGMPENNTKEYDGNPVTVTSTIKTEVPGADDIRNQVIVEYYKDGVKVTDTSAYGTYEVKVSVIEGNNYNAVNALKLGEFSVTKAVLDIAEITVTDPENNIYDGNEKIPTINIPDGAGTVKDIKYYDEKGTEVTSPTDAGTYTVKITTENATNYADITTLTEVGTFEIQKREITVKVADKSSMYGQDLEELTCDVTVGSIVLGDTLESILDLATVATETSNVGEYAITGTEKATNKNYDIIFVDGTYEITQREITVTIQDKTSEYRKNLVELTGSVTIGSLATGDILENIVNLTTTATNTSNVGNYDITGSVNNNNYAVTFTNENGNSTKGKYEITRATLTAEDFDKTIPTDKEYDGSALTATASIKAGIVGAGTTVTVKYYKNGVETTNTSDYGTYIVKVNINEGENYFAANGTAGLPEIEIGSFSITKKQLALSDIEMTPKTFTYNGTKQTPNVTAKVSGAGTIVATYWQGSTEVANPTDVGTYTVKITTTGATNYENITTPMEVGTYEIEKVDLTLNDIEITTPAAKEYDGQPNTAVAKVKSTVLGADDVVIDIKYYKDGTEKFPVDAGTYTIKVSSNGGKNYNPLTLTETTESVVVNKKTLKIEDVIPSITLPATKIYDGNETIITATVPTGAGAVTITYYKQNGTKTTEMRNADTYTVKVSVLDGTNYTGLSETELGTYTIGKAMLTAEDFDKTIPTNKEYDGSALTATASIKAGIVGAGTTVTVKYYKNGVETTNTSDYGTYIVKVNINEGENYFAANGTAGLPEIEIGSFSITKKQLALSDIEMTPKTFTYNGTKQTPNVTAKVSGAGTIVATYWQGSTEVANPTDVGTYTVKITTTGATNYENITTPIEIGTYEITARPVTVTIDNKTSIYGDAIDTLTSNVTVGDVITGDDLGITLTKAEGTDVDEYAITGTATNTNYDVTFVDGKYTITARSITISIDDKESAIKDELVELTYQVTVGTVVGTDEVVVLETNANKDIVDAYDITVRSENSNYNVAIANTDEKAVYTVKDKVKEIKLSNDTIEGNCGTSLEDLIKGITYTVVYEGAGEQTPVALTTAMIKTSYNENSTETQSLTVEYTDNDTNSATNGDTFEAILNVSLKDTLTSIRVENATLEYYEGQTFNADNKMEVTAEYSVADDKKVTNYIIKDKNGNILNRPLTQADSGIVTIEYEEDGVKVSKDITITVKPDVITDITFNFNGTTEYDFGDNIDLGTSTVTKVWASGKTENVSMTLDMLSITEKPSFDFANMNEIGTYNVKVTIDGKTSDNTFQITVKDAIESISIVDKTILEKDYNYNQAIDVTGGQISINYKSGNTVIEDITTGMLSGYSMTTVKDNQTVTVTYTDNKGNKYTDTFKINVKDAIVGIDITKEPIKKLYKLNEMQDFGDIEVTNVMASGNLGIKLVASEYTITGFDSTKVGEQTITVTKVGTTYSDTFKVKIIDVTTDMFISDLPKVNYNYGEGLSLTGGTITVKTEGNTVGTVIPMTDSSVTVTGYNPNRLGDQTLTVTYIYTEETETGVETRQKTDTYTVKVEDYETGVIITPPTKTTYDYGMPLDLTGATVSKVWASGKTTDTTEISGGMISEYSATTLGLQTIKVNAFGKDNVGSFNVTVVDKTLGISMKKLPNKIEYTEGEGIDVTGAVLNVTKLSGTKEIPVTKEMISGYNPGKIGTQVITVTYDGFTTEFVVNVKEAEKKPNKPNRPVNPSKPATSEVDKYTVTFIDYDGSVIKTEEVEIGKSATAPKLEERKGYKFLGWDTDFEVIEKDIIVMAKYEEVIRAKVNAPDDMEVEKGEDLDLSDVTIEIFDGEGNRIDEIPVTKDMISGFDSEKVGTQIVRVTYIGEDGFEYTDTFKVRVKRPAEVLGVKDEATTEESNLNGIIIPTAIGIGAIGILLLLIALATRKNVEIYAITEDERKLVGKEKITKNNRRIDLDEYEKKLAKSNIEIVLNKNITRKLDEEMVDIIFKGKKSTYKVKDIDNKEFSIKMKNA